MRKTQRGKQRRKTQRVKQRGKQMRKTRRDKQMRKTRMSKQMRKTRMSKQRSKQRRKPHLKLKGGSAGVDESVEAHGAIEFSDIPSRLKESKAIFHKSYEIHAPCVRASMHSLFYPWYISKLRKFIAKNPNILVGKIIDPELMGDGGEIWRGTMVNIKGIAESTNFNGEILADIAKFDCTHILPEIIPIHIYEGAPVPGTVLNPVPLERWTPDRNPACEICFSSFTILNRKHHCRSCGRLLCGKCSSDSLIFPGEGVPKRVCYKCKSDWEKVSGTAVINAENQLLRIEGSAPATTAGAYIIETSTHEISPSSLGDHTFFINWRGKSVCYELSDPNPDPNLIRKMLSPRLSLPILCIGDLGFVDHGDDGPVTDARIWEFMNIYNKWCDFFDNISSMTKEQKIEVMSDVYEGLDEKFTGHMRGMDGLELLAMELLYKKLDILEPGGKLIHHCVYETETEHPLLRRDCAGMGPMYMPLTGAIATECVTNEDYKKTDDIRIALHHIYEYLLTPSDAEKTRVIFAEAQYAPRDSPLRQSGHAFLLARTIKKGIDYYCYVDAANEGDEDEDGISLCEMVQRPNDKAGQHKACEKILQVICDLMSDGIRGDDEHGDIKDLWKFLVCIPVAGLEEVVPDGNGPIEVYGYDDMLAGEMDWQREFEPYFTNTMDIYNWYETSGFNERSVKYATRDPYHAGGVDESVEDNMATWGARGPKGRTARRSNSRITPY